MRIADMDWQSVEDWTRHDDRAVLPLGSTEQHAGLSLATDSILAERVSIEAAQPLDVPVFPVLPYGVAPAFAAFPGSVNLRVATFALVIRDVLDSLKRSGFRRLLIVNGHGGNQPAAAVAQEWMMDNPDARVRFHDWWRAPATMAAIRAIDPEGGHASWFENFAWTRLNGQAPMHSKPRVDVDRLRTLPPFEARALLEDGCYGGLYQRDESDLRQVWSAAVAETRAMIDAW